MSASAPHPDDLHMSFGEHLDELRRRLIYALIGVAAACVVTFYYGQEIVAWLVTPLAHAQREVGLPAQTYAPGVMTPMLLFMKVGLIAGFVLAAPWVLYQLWKFISAGLYAGERRVVALLAPFSAVMTLLGVLFAYYIVLPAALFFLLYFATTYPPAYAGDPTMLDRAATAVQGAVSSVMPGQPTTAPATQPAPTPSPGIPASPPARADAVSVVRADPENPAEGQVWIKQPECELRVYIDGRVRVIPLSTSSLVVPWIDLDNYISFVLYLILAMVVAFQLPVIMMVMGWTGLIEPATVARYRRHCIFACFAAAAVITPTWDPFNLVLMAGTMWLLYEAGLVLMRLTYRRPAAAAGGPA